MSLSDQKVFILKDFLNQGSLKFVDKLVHILKLFLIRLISVKDKKLKLNCGRNIRSCKSSEAVRDKD